MSVSQLSRPVEISVKHFTTRRVFLHGHNPYTTIPGDYETTDPI